MEIIWVGGSLKSLNRKSQRGLYFVEATPAFLILQFEVSYENIEQDKQIPQSTGLFRSTLQT